MNVFQKRRTQLFDSLDCDVIALTGNRLIQQSADLPYPFSQDRYFYYLSGVDEPDWRLVITADQHWLIEPPHDELRQLFDGATDRDLIIKTAGAQILPHREGTLRLREVLKEAKKIGTLAAKPRYMKRAHMFASPARKQFIEEMKRQVASERLHDISPQLARQRMVKDESEIAEIEAMVRQTNRVLSSIEPELWSYNTEKDVERAITSAFVGKGLSHAYAPIVASGKNAATIHYNDNDAKLRLDRPLLIDAGARKTYYAADITRTYQPPNLQGISSAAMPLVNQVQQQLIDFIEPGMNMKEVESKAEDMVGEALIELGLINSKLTKHIRDFYPHSFGHFLGLDVHDPGDYEAPLEEGMVITVEPGIYSQEHEFGIRIEDDVVITETGARVLGYNKNN